MRSGVQLSSEKCLITSGGGGGEVAGKEHYVWLSRDAFSTHCRLPGWSKACFVFWCLCGCSAHGGLMVPAAACMP